MTTQEQTDNEHLDKLVNHFVEIEEANRETLPFVHICGLAIECTRVISNRLGEIRDTITNSQTRLRKPEGGGE